MIAAVSAFAQIEKQIKATRSEVNLINKSAAKYDKRTKLVEGISLEGTEATYFTSGRGLKKITAKMYGETFRATAELFYSGEELIFAYQRLQRYDTQIGMKPPPKIRKIIETRVYYSGAKAIRVIEDKKQHAAADSEFSAAESAMNDLSEKLKAAIDQ
ncbi:MAG: hypothetical protein WBD27_11975 [Pyrinomonadaceae bacterium]